MKRFEVGGVNGGMSVLVITLYQLRIHFVNKEQQ